MPSREQLIKPFVVPVFIPHAGCPHRCAFCNQHSTTGQGTSMPTVSAIRTAIQDFLAHRRDPRRPTEIAFYGGSFLGLPREQVQLLLTTATRFVQQGQADGIRFSTRPDTIDPPRLAWLAPFPVTTVELGVQSMSDPVLESVDRGHTAADTCRAIALLKARPYQLGLQMMVGLPGDTPEASLATAHQLAGLAPDFVRIYPALVLRGSRLARWYLRGQYTPMDLEATVTLVAALFQIFARHAIPVIRMGLQATANLTDSDQIIAGPFHPAFGERVHSAVWLDAIARHLERHGLQNTEIHIDAPTRLLSQIKGALDANRRSLMDRFQLSGMAVRADGELPEDRVLINGIACRKLSALIED
ncbi:MAG: radical SAM protein [Desulfatitalea sp.]|nr:radical SAM protein [Desulfatitalea sp.]